MLPRLVPIICLAAIVSAVPRAVDAQVRGVYPLGMSAVNSGVTPEPGFSYVNMLLFYSRDTLEGDGRETVATGRNSVILAMNSFVWVDSHDVLGGGRFSMSATLPITNNSLASDSDGTISGGGGFADSYYQPFILGWNRSPFSWRAVYGFLAPTGDFDANSQRNVGSGYWTHTLSSGQTWATSGGGLTVSAFEMYERHTTQKDTGIRPGDTISLDYSLVHGLTLPHETRLHVGLAGYQQWQTTEKRGPAVSPADAATRYVVNAVGLAAGVAWPRRHTSLSIRYFREFSNRSTFEGYSVQTSGAIGF